jgi:hypothetical protein
MSRQEAEDVAAVCSFLAMAVKEKLILNGRTAREAWDAHIRLLRVSQEVGNELLCKMLGDEPEA